MLDWMQMDGSWIGKDFAPRARFVLFPVTRQRCAGGWNEASARRILESATFNTFLERLNSCVRETFLF